MQIDIKVSPVLKEYYDYYSGGIVTLSKHSPLHHTIKQLLETIPDTYKFTPNHEDTVRIVIPELNNRFYSKFYLSERSQRIVERYLKDEFNTKLFTTISTHYVGGGSQKDGILLFCRINGINMDGIDLNSRVSSVMDKSGTFERTWNRYEQMKKAWDRSDQKKEAERIIRSYKKSENFVRFCPFNIRMNLNNAYHG